MDKLIIALDNWSGSGYQDKPNGLPLDMDTGEPLLTAIMNFPSELVQYLPTEQVPANTKYFYPIKITSSKFFVQGSPFRERALYLSEKVLQDVRNGLCRIIFDYSTEGQPNTEKREEVFAIQAQLLNIKLSSMAYADANFLTPYIYKTIPAYYYNSFESVHAGYFSNNYDSTVASITSRASRKKRFVFFNRRAHMHRVLLVEKVLADGLDKDMILTLGNSSYGWPTLSPELEEQHLTQNRFKHIAERIPNVMARAPITYDITDYYNNNPTDLNIQAQLDAYICIVTETFYYVNPDCPNLYLSEKTFKPIACLQPFIAVNVPHSLKQLRALGYKTFAPYIDESYDDEVNPETRLDLIYKEIKRLSSLTEDEVKDLLVNLLPTLQYNYNLYQQRSKENTGYGDIINAIAQDWKNNGTKNICMVGMGKLGKDCAEVMATKHFVTGYDIRPVQSDTVKIATTLEDAVRGRDIIFIAVPTPHDSAYGGEGPTSHLEPKDFDYTILKDVISKVHDATTSDQLIVLISTVLPGTVRNQFIQILQDRRFVYNPYLIAMGTFKNDMINPEMIIIGTKDGNSNADSEELINFYKSIVNEKTRIVQGTWDEAECIKIFYNTFISAKLALVNMVQDVAEKNGNIDVDVVTNALKDSTYRIMGPAYMTAGMGDGGACHPRDNIALRYMAQRLNLGYDLFDGIMKSREVQAENLALRCVQVGSNVCIVGKAYKPGVPYTNGSYSLLIGWFIEHNDGGTVTYFDPNTGDNVFNDKADIYLIGYWEDWVEKIKWPDNCTVIDPWRKFKTDNTTIKVIHYGKTR